MDKSVAGIELAGDVLVVAADQVTGHRVASGAQTWDEQLRGARIAVTGDARMILAATDRALSLLDVTGSRRWQVPFPAAASDAMPERLTTDGPVAYLTFRQWTESSESTVDVVAFRLDGSAP